MAIIDVIIQLEKGSNKERTEYIKQILRSMDVSFTSQPFRQRILTGENIIVDQFCDTSGSQLLLTAHTNKYFSSPGANDNASGVAVLLELIRHLKHFGSNPNVGVTFAFFDHEDGLAFLDGSTYFVNHSDVSKIAFVFNFDGVGMGNTITISPNIDHSTNEYLDTLKNYLDKEKLPFFTFDLPPLIIEDHIPFVRKSIPAISLNLIPKSDLVYLQYIMKASWIKKFFVNFFYRGFLNKRHPMKIMRHRHNDLDTSVFIQKESLQLAFQIAMHIIHFHARKGLSS